MVDKFYSREQVAQCRESLVELAKQPRTSFTKKQVFDELFDDIEEALKTRSYDELAKMFTASGLDVSVGALKQYLAKCRKSRQSTAKQKRRSGNNKREAAQRDIKCAESQKNASMAPKALARRKTAKVTAKRMTKVSEKRTAKATNKRGENDK